jgi:hypothetical protein
MKTARPGDRSMMLRLVLVGAVAVLGVTVPSQPMCEQWFASAQTWASSVLADWDNWTPAASRWRSSTAESGARVCEHCRRLAEERLAADLRTAPSAADEKPGSDTVADSTANRESVGRADALPADVFAPAVVAFNPISVPEQSYMGIAYELNGLDGDPDDWTVTTPTVPVAQPDAGQVVYVLSDDLELALLGELARSVKTSAEGPIPKSVDGPENASSLDTDQPFLCGVQTEDVEDPIAVPPASPQVQASERVALVADSCVDVESEFICETERMTLDVAVAVAPKPAAELPWPAFTPAGTADQPDTEVDIALLGVPSVGGSDPADASASELDQSSTYKPRAPSGSSTGDGTEHVGLNQAVELTRNAAFAWMRVLTGPAVVNVSAR